MPQFRVILTGTGMKMRDGCTGFATTRFVKSDSEEEAAEKALAMVTSAAAKEPVFLGAGNPTLSIDTVSRIRFPFKRARLERGYTLIGPGASLEDAVRLEREAASS